MFMTKTIKRRPDEFAKECVIMHIPSKRLMKYDEKSEILYFDPESFTVFPSKQKALSARHHAIETEKSQGIEREWKEYYQVIET